MLEELRGLLVFAQVVETRSFSGAARRLGITRSAVSKHVQQLEARLGVQLLVRTTRRLALTEVGERVYEASAGIRERVETAQEAASSHAGSISGALRITAPAALGRKHVVPVVTDFMRLHPALSIELLLTDEFVDLLAARVDVALRVGRVVEPSLVTRRLARVRLRICASPSYLVGQGTPRTPRALAACEWIRHLPSSEPNRVILRKGSKQFAIPVHGRLACNEGAAAVQAAVAGFGVMLAPEFEISDELRSGRLVPLLTSYRFDDLFVQAVFPPRRHVSTKLRAFTDFVAERWRVAPWEVG